MKNDVRKGDTLADRVLGPFYLIYLLLLLLGHLLFERLPRFYLMCPLAMGGLWSVAYATPDHLEQVAVATISVIALMLVVLWWDLTLPDIENSEI